MTDTSSSSPAGSAAAPTRDEIEGLIRDATSGRSGPGHDRLRSEAVAALVAHANLGYRAVVDKVRATQGAVPHIELLGRFDRAESTPMFGDLLIHGSPDARREAGMQLGLASDPAALAVLVAALGQESSDTLVGALEGLRARRAASACDPARALTAHRDAEVRYVAVDVLSELRCLSAEQLERLSRDDDAAVRKLAGERRAALPP